MTELIMPRRQFLKGLFGLVAAPAVVKSTSIMPVKAMPVELARNEVSIAYAIARENVRQQLLDNQYAAMNRALLESFQQTKEIYAANVLNGFDRWAEQTQKIIKSS